MVRELEEDAKQYGDQRRTLIKADERAQVERTVVEEPITVILSQKGWIRARSGHGLDASSLVFKDGDGLQQTLECRTTDPVILLAASGKTLHAGRGGAARRAAATARRSIRWSTPRPTTSSGWARATWRRRCS